MFSGVFLDTYSDATLTTMATGDARYVASDTGAPSMSTALKSYRVVVGPKVVGPSATSARLLADGVDPCANAVAKRLTLSGSTAARASEIRLSTVNGLYPQPHMQGHGMHHVTRRAGVCAGHSRGAGGGGGETGPSLTMVHSE